MKLQRKQIFRLLLLLPFLAHSVHTFAQSDPSGEAPATRTYAIKNATIVQAPGKVLEVGTIVIKNGLIHSISADSTAPADAEIIDGKDLYIYPGFIDGMAYTAASRPEQMERPDDLLPYDPPNEYAGITPEHSVVNQIDLSESSIDGMRKLGFTVSHSVPYGRMLPGSGSIIFLSDKSDVDDLILYKDVSMYTQFSGAPGAYPSNVLGIMAKWRNLYINATNSKQHAELYASNPAGMVRPERNRALEAFYPVVEKQKPVYYNANSALEARRAMRLQKELGFNLVLGNLLQGWDLADEIKATNTTVFMSLDLPDEPEMSDSADVDAEVLALEARRMEFYEMYVNQYTALKGAGITFGFSSIDASANSIKDHLMTIADSSRLGPDATLAALTIDAATLLGIDKMVGTLDEGKIGNLVVSTAPYFSEDAKVKFVFVDGDKYEYETATRGGGRGGAGGGAPAGGMAAVVGTWNYTLTSPQGDQTGTLEISMEGSELKGVLTSDDGSPDAELGNLTYVAGTLSFDFSFDAGGQDIEIVIVGDVADGEYSAEATVAAFNMSFPFEATKQVPNN